MGAGLELGFGVRWWQCCYSGKCNLLVHLEMSDFYVNIILMIIAYFIH